MKTLLALMVVALSGCSSYMVPGRAADMSIFGPAKDKATDAAVREAFNREPLASMPASLAVARVQAPGYDNYRHYGSYGTGRYSLVTVRDIETDEDYARLRRLPMVYGVAPMSRLLVSGQLNSDEDLRRGAASLRAELLLIYTLDTQFVTDDFAPPLTVVTLGLFPSKTASCRTTASAVLLDTRTGFVYATAEGTGSADQLANGWTNSQAVEDARQRCERRALSALLGEFEKAWPGVVAMQSGRTPGTTTWTVAPAGTPVQQTWSTGAPAPVGPTYRTRE